MMKVLLVLAVVHLKLQFCQAASNIRLKGGKSDSEGRVEVFYNGSWGTVCDDRWGLKDANVVCRSLGLSNATSAPYKAPFGQGSGPIWMDDVQCSGSETSLLECPHKGFGSHDCGHKEDAGVACGYPPMKNFTITNLTGVITSPGYPNAMERANYAWIFKPSVPRPVAVLYFEEIDLTRRNRGVTELSVKNSKNVTVIHIKNEKRKPWSGWILTDPGMVRFYSIFTLRHTNGLNGRGFRLRYFIFSNLGDKGSCLPHWSVQVSAGVGLLNVSWNPLTNIPNVKYLVVYNATGKDIQNFTMVTNGTSARIIPLRTDTLYSIQLIGFNPTSVSPVMYSCARLKQTKAVSWLLLGGRQHNEGIIQMNYNDKWGPICALKWDINDAKVACRTLKLPPATHALVQSGQFNVSKRQPWVANLQCLGNETSLLDCPHGGWGNLPGLCRVDYTAGVVCGYPNVTKIDITSVFGIITNPGYPSNVEQAHYVWTIRPALPRARVVVYFEDITLSRHDLGVSNLTMTDAVGTRLLFVQNRNKPRFSYRFNTTTPKIVFYSSFTSGRKKRGFRMFYLVLDDVQPSLRDNWNISATSTSQHSLRVHWSTFNSTNMNLIAYLITHEAKKRPGTVFYSIADKSSNAIVINNLVGYTHYNVHVFAYLREINTGTHRMYMGKLIDVQTLEGVPDRAPPNIAVTFINFRYVHFKWNPIPRENVHGNLIGYNVYYQDYKKTNKKTIITTASNHLYAVLTNLIPAMKYYLQIAGFTAKGQGQIQTLSFLTKCGDVIENRLTGTILIPNIVSRNWDVDCEWTLKSQYRNALIVVMIDVATLLPSYYPCSQLYINLINGKKRTMDTFCAKRQLVSLVSYSSAKLRFHLSSSWPFRREVAMKFKPSYLILRNGFENVQLYPDWKITVTHHNYTTITVQWDKLPKIAIESAKFVAVCISDTDDIHAGSAKSSATNVQVGNLRADSQYKVRVLAFLGNLSSIDMQSDILKTPTITIRTLKKDYNPRFPLRHDINNTVRMKVKGLSVLQWNQLYDHTFKKTLAREVTSFCLRDKRCPRPRKRAKRSVIDYIIFTSVQVHFVPGYPMQTSYSYNPENMIAALAFYLKFPPESGMDSKSVLQQTVLLDAVKASVGPLGKAINKTILSVSAHRGVFTVPPTSNKVTVAPPKKSQINKAAIIGGSVTAAVILIVIIASVLVIARGHCFMKQEDEQPVIELRHSEANHDELYKPEENPPPMSHDNQQEETQQEERQERPTEITDKPEEQGGADVGKRVMELDI